MTFLRKLTLALAIPTVMVIGAGGTVALGAYLLETRLASYFEREDAWAGSVGDMLAQGLQMGQALRNVVLDPANRRAYENLDAARVEYENARARAERAATGSQRAALERIDTVRARLAGIQAQIIERAGRDHAGAAEALNRDETPTWRELRGMLLEMKQKADGDKQAVAAATSRDIRFGRWLVFALSTLCGGACLLFLVSTRRALRRNIGGHPEEACAILNQVAGGDLAITVPVRAGDDRSLMAALRQTCAQLATTVAGVRRSADSVAAISHELAHGNQDLSSRTEAQASSLQQTAATMEQITATVRQSADNARQADQIAAAASQAAQRGGTAVGRVVSTMVAINASSMKIAEIVGVIDSIAFQTNILALNASVEAARAGEQGRGFAVVAAEVRNLAQRCAQAARQIKELIDDSSEKVDIGSEQVAEAHAAMTDIVGQAKRVADLIGAITTAALEQSGGIGQVNQAIAQLDQMTQQNAALVEQSAAAAQSLKDQAARLAGAISAFSVGRGDLMQLPA